MGKQDRKQQKKKQRQDRLRREKHERHFGQGSGGDVLFGGDRDEEVFDPGLNLPPPTATERAMRGGAPNRFWETSVQALGRRSDDHREQAQELAYDAGSSRPGGGR